MAPGARRRRLGTGRRAKCWRRVDNMLGKARSVPKVVDNPVASGTCLPVLLVLPEGATDRKRQFRCLHWNWWLRTEVPLGVLLCPERFDRQLDDVARPDLAARPADREMDLLWIRLVTANAIALTTTPVDHGDGARHGVHGSMLTAIDQRRLIRPVNDCAVPSSATPVGTLWTTG